MNTKLFQKYVSLKNEIAKLLEEENLLKSSIVEEMQNNSLEKIQNDFGKFTIAKRLTYSYSDKVSELEEKVKIAKHKEIEKGVAKVKNTTSYLLFTQDK